MVIEVVLVVVIFMQGIYNSTVETNHVSRVYSIAAILYLQIKVHVRLFLKFNILKFYTSALRSTCAVPSVAVSCGSSIS
jgi:hypothetical protein